MSGQEGTAARAVTDAEALRRLHGARARSAYDRAVAACRYAGVGQDAAVAVPRDPVGRAANALRLSAESLAALNAGAPDPAADARCARNAAATAALAAQVAAARDGRDTTDGTDGTYSTEGTEGTEGAAASAAALRAALAASRAAAVAAGGSALGRNAALNASAREAERHAVATARAAGWLDIPTGVHTDTR
ncbi:hypothetical protein GCM10010260_43690 [Streptomyces filipinensis]|uniref:Uncharacterized protein n=1 Tax=Streptomyces filipinensis TaxID=66887 RepID=A0A918ICN4_9ACTN|nr:hypothetical protein [Streptomyces filipinensis]GGV02182.1 hypothetical protein GCM10010260_43690 [Streptomyces filipinensis]